MGRMTGRAVQQPGERELADGGVVAFGGRVELAAGLGQLAAATGNQGMKAMLCFVQ